MSRLENLAIAVHTELDDATVQRVMYRRRDGRHGQRRRIHWYSDGGDVRPADRAGAKAVDGDTNKIPQVWSRFERVACLVFAENVDTLDALIDNLIVAVDRTAPNGSVIFDGYTWDYDEVAQRIPMSELIFEVQWPVADEVKALTEITAEELTCEFEEEE